MTFRVLMIDDNADHRFLVQRALRGLDVHLTLAEDGERGIAALREGAHDLVLLDVKMPLVDGFEVLRRLASGALRPRVIMLSSSEDARDQARAAELGAQGFVTKPLDAAAFQAIVRDTVVAAQQAAR